MTKEQLWQAHVAKNPAWANDDTKLQLTVGNLKKLLMNAHELGYKHGCTMSTKLYESLYNTLKGKKP